MTVVAIPSSVLEDLKHNEQNFTFVYHGREWRCCREAAGLIAPVLHRLWRDNPSMSTFEIQLDVPILFVGVYFNQLTGRNLVISRGNSAHIRKVAEYLGNDEVIMAVNLVETDRENPEEMLAYVLDHCRRGISVIYDVAHMASRFEHYFALPKFTQLPAEVFQTMLKSNSMRNEYRRLARECFEQAKHKYSTLDQYMTISNPLTRKEEIEINFEMTSELRGIIAYMSALAGKNVIDARALSIDTLYPVKDIKNLVNFVDPNTSLRLLPVDGVNMILYDFRERRISLTGFTIVVGDENVEKHGEGPKQWALLGSNNLLNWSVVYESRGEPELTTRYASKTFTCAKTEYFRFIRYEQISNCAKQAKHANVINLDAIEFYGHCMVL